MASSTASGQTGSAKRDPWEIIFMRLQEKELRRCFFVCCHFRLLARRILQPSLSLVYFHCDKGEKDEIFLDAFDIRRSHRRPRRPVLRGTERSGRPRALKPKGPGARPLKS
ncbi:unnamed protein product [Urochloa humidicola]